MGVSENSGTPKSSILIVFSIINHPFWGTPILGNTHIISTNFQEHNRKENTNSKWKSAFHLNKKSWHQKRVFLNNLFSFWKFIPTVGFWIFNINLMFPAVLIFFLGTPLLCQTLLVHPTHSPQGPWCLANSPSHHSALSRELTQLGSVSFSEGWRLREIKRLWWSLGLRFWVKYL